MDNTERAENKNAPAIRPDDEGEVFDLDGHHDSIDLALVQDRKPEMVDWALRYAEKGWPVHPLKARNKVPLTEHGLKDATTDPAQIRAWWREWPDANIGTPVPEGFLVVDVDVQHGGTREQLHVMPVTVRAQTGGGGWHYWTRVYDAKLTGKFRGLTGIDVRKAGNYVVLPPSVHPSGNRYVWEISPFSVVPIADLPKHLLDRVVEQPRKPRSAERGEPVARPEPPESLDPDGVAEYFLTAAKDRCEEGSRNETGFWLACQLRDNGVDERDAEAVMRDYAEYASGVGNTPYEEKEALGSLQQAYSQPPRDPTEFGSNQTPEPAEVAEGAPLGVCLADVEAKPVEWLWPARIPLGKVSGLDGDPGLGKSFITLDLAARVSRGGTLPDGEQAQQGSVLLISLEDDLADTIRPRLEAAGADLTRIHSLAEVPVDEEHKRPFVLPNDLGVLERAITRYGAVLVIIDPLMACLNGKVDSHKDQHVRTDVMAPLKTVAERTGAAILMVRHLNKNSSGNPLYRGGGSIGIVGAMRASLMVAPDPDDPTRRVLAMTKSNLSKEAPSLAYRIVGSEQGRGALEWAGTSNHTAATLCQAQGQATREKRYSDLTQRIIAALGESAMTVGEIAERVGVDVDTVRRPLSRLEERGDVIRLSRGRYRRTSRTLAGAGGSAPSPRQIEILHDMGYSDTAIGQMTRQQAAVAISRGPRQIGH